MRDSPAVALGYSALRLGRQVDVDTISSGLTSVQLRWQGVVLAVRGRHNRRAVTFPRDYLHEAERSVVVTGPVARKASNAQALDDAPVRCFAFADVCGLRIVAL